MKAFLLKNKVEVVFLNILFFQLFFIFSNIEFYPALKFPHFKNNGFGNEISYIKTEVVYKGEKINLANHFRPYDKRFYLFYLRKIASSKDIDKDLILLNKLALEKEFLKISIDTLKYDLDN